MTRLRAASRFALTGAAILVTCMIAGTAIRYLGAFAGVGVLGLAAAVFARATERKDGGLR